MKWVIYLVLLVPAPLLAGTFTAATCSKSDVNSVINGSTHTAVDGDIIIIPAGSCTWGTNTSGDTALSITAGITLEGAGLSTGNNWNTADMWLQMNTSSPGTTLTPTILGNGTNSGTTFTWAIVGTNAGLTVGSTQGGMGGSITVGPAGTNYPVGTTTQAIALNSADNFTYVTAIGFPGGLSAMTINGSIVFGASNQGFSAQDMDLVRIDDVNGHYVVLQLVPGNLQGGGVGYGVRIETDGSGTIHDCCILLTQGNRYLFSLLLDNTGGEGALAMFDPSNNNARLATTDGRPALVLAHQTGSTISKAYIGNVETGTATGTMYFEDIMFDWTNHIFPNYPQPQDVGTTVIYDDNYKGNGSCQNDVPAISIAPTSNVGWRVAGFTISGLATNPNGCQPGHLQIGGQSHAFRVDHMTFQNATNNMILSSGGLWGVIDHNQMGTGTSTNTQPVEAEHDAWLGVGSNGDNSWAQPDTMGTNEAIFIETNTFGQNLVTCNDSDFGGRVVNRFNWGCTDVQAHGLDSTQRGRSTRQFEIYNNNFWADSINNIGVHLRGGTGMIFNNTFNDSGSTNTGTMIQADNYRDTDEYPPWAGTPGRNGTTAFGSCPCDGNSYYDTNNGGATPTVYASGTAGASSTTDNLVPSSAPGWTTNQYVNYSVVNTTQNWGSIISANSTTAATSVARIQSDTAHNWSNGDSFLILFAYPCADMIGRGQGALLQNSNPVLQSTGNPGPVSQSLDPMYQWLNTRQPSGTSAVVSSSSQRVLANREYYDYTTSFTGATGVGSGILSSRPATCTTGVGYWATDQGNWNNSGSGGQGALYICTATNTWTLSYTPYTYPHPLTLGSSTSSTGNGGVLSHGATVQ